MYSPKIEQAAKLMLRQQKREDIPQPMRISIRDVIPDHDAIVEERETISRSRLGKILSRDRLFRLAYVPFVISELAWDYAETILDLASLLRLEQLRRLTRAIRVDLRRQYLRERFRFCEPANLRHEQSNAIVFEEAVKKHMEQFVATLQMDIRREHPDLPDDMRELIVAAYQCEVLLSSLDAYERNRREDLAATIGRNVGHILPPQMHSLRKLIPLFRLNRSASRQWLQGWPTWVRIFTARMLDAELDDTPIDPACRPKETFTI